MLSLTAVSPDKMYSTASLPDPREMYGKKKFSMKETLATQKLLNELNNRLNNNNIAGKRHLGITSIQTESYFKHTEPVITNYSHQTQVLRETVEGYDQKVDQLQSEISTGIKRKATDIELQLNALLNRATSTFKINEEQIERINEQTDKITEFTQSKMIESQIDLKELQAKTQTMVKKSDVTFKHMKERLSGIEPRIKDQEIKVAELENIIQQIIALYKQIMQILTQFKRANKNLQHLADEGVEILVNEHFQKLVTHLSELAGKFDRKNTDIQFKNDEIDQTQKIHAADNETMIIRLNEISRSIGDCLTQAGTLDSSLEEEFNSMKKEITDTIGRIKAEIKAKEREIRYRRWKMGLKANRELDYCAKVANVRLTKLQDDWREFNGNFSDTTGEVEAIADEIQEIVGDDTGKIVDRIELAYAKMMWIRKRLLVWQRTAVTETDIAMTKINEAEKSLLELERNLKAIDGKKSISPLGDQSKSIKPLKLPKPIVEPENAFEYELGDKHLTYTPEEIEAFEDEPDIPPDTFEEEEFPEDDFSEESTMRPDYLAMINDALNKSGEEENTNDEQTYDTEDNGRRKKRRSKRRNETTDEEDADNHRRTKRRGADRDREQSGTRDSNRRSNRRGKRDETTEDEAEERKRNDYNDGRRKRRAAAK